MFRRGSRGGRGRRGMYTYSRVFPSMKEEDFEEYNKLFDRESEREYNPYNEYSPWQIHSLYQILIKINL